MRKNPSIVVIGLGYVGLPLAVALSRKFSVHGFDIDRDRIDELRRGEDRTGEISAESLSSSPVIFGDDPELARGADVYIVTVPTPVDDRNQPDLTAVIGATRMLASLLDPAKRPTIVYESTVFPGVTEDICGLEIERVSGLTRGRDFRLGYSPERINPGDHTHRVDTIMKVVSGEDTDVVEQLAYVYGSITSGGVFRAASIKAAEAAKAIENAQRDINIAFINEVAQITSRLGLSIWDVLEAARTKWNFLAFEPGLVGGHCIGVDPYYMSHLAQSLGHHPQVILAGRETNDQMGCWIADRLNERQRPPGRALVLGLTFKENVPDLRNSRSFDLINRLTSHGWQVAVHDPFVTEKQLGEIGLRGTDLISERFDLVVLTVSHDEYCVLQDAAIRNLVAPGGTLADIKGIWRKRRLEGVDYWTL